MKYTFHTFSEGFSSALYRPGIQLVIASFISKEDANLLFFVELQNTLNEFYYNPFDQKFTGLSFSCFIR